MAKKIGRNDPCPCGGGKEYKRCCLGRGGETAPAPADAMGSIEQELEAALAVTIRALERFAAFFGLADTGGRMTLQGDPEIRATPLLSDAFRFSTDLGGQGAGAGGPVQRLENTWQGRRVNMGYVKSERTFVIAEFWMSWLDELIVHHKMFARGESGSRSLLDAVKDRQPAELCVADRARAEELQKMFPHMPVRVGATPELDEFVREMLENMPNDGGRVPPYLMAGIDADSMGHLFNSVAALHEAAPRDYMDDWQVVPVDIPALDVEGACISVMGAASEDIGVRLSMPTADEWAAIGGKSSP